MTAPLADEPRRRRPASPRRPKRAAASPRSSRRRGADARARARSRPDARRAARPRRSFALPVGAGQGRSGAARPAARGARPSESLDALVRGARLRGATSDEAELMRALRRAKRESALLVALADIGGVWDVVAGDRGADPLRRRRRRRRARLPAAPARARRAARARSGRARSENGLAASSCWRSASTARASSTIRATSTSSCSTIPRRPRFRREREPGPLFVRIAKALARLLQERTSDGYVLRVDLRLRPDPASTPVALSTAERLCLLRDGRPELGARGAHQGAAGRPATSRSASASSPSSRRSSGASISTMRRSPTSTR